MKSLKSIVLIFIVVCMVSCNEMKKKERVDSSDQQIPLVSKNSKVALRESLNTFTQALIEPSEKVLDRITDDKLSYGHSSGLIQNKSEFIDDVLHGGFDFLSIDLLDQKIIYKDHLAVVRHVFMSQAIKNEQAVDVKIGVILVWSFNSNGWKLIARQAYQLKN